MDVREKIAQFLYEYKLPHSPGFWNNARPEYIVDYRKCAKELLALPELDGYYREKGWKSPEEVYDIYWKGRRDR